MKMFNLILLSFLTHVCMSQHVLESAQIKQTDEQLNVLIQRNNTREAEKYYAEDFILTTSAGKSKFKGGILKEIGSNDLLLEISKTNEVTVRELGSTAVLTGILHQKGSFKGKTFDVLLLVTDTWVLTENGRKLLPRHASSIPKTYL